MITIEQLLKSASFSKGMVGNKNIIIGVNKEPLQTLQREVRKLYNNNNISIDPNKDIRYIQNGTDIAHKAKLLSHEFCEALNEVDFHKKARPIDADIRRWGNDEIFHDSHMSGHVLGNDFLINNKLYGSSMGAPEYEIRANDSSYSSVNNEYIGNEAISNPDNSLVANTIGLNYSKLDGGFERFREPKQLYKFLNKSMKDTNNFFDGLQQYVDPVEVWLRRNVKGYNSKNRLFKVQTNQLFEALNDYFPNMVYPDAINYDFNKLVNYYINLYLKNN